MGHIDLIGGEGFESIENQCVTNTRQRLLLPLGVMLTVSLVYANHFQNGFHFDDAHTVVNNPWIRSLSHLPNFFSDGATFSVLPSNQGYRPLVSTTLAMDYALGGGLKPWAFHLGTFFLFLIQLGLMAWLFEGVLRRALGIERAWLFSWLSVWLYGLHPIGAETVNYIIQRADLYVALGLVAGLALYVQLPGSRRSGLYLLPFGLAALSKPTALIFPLLLLSYHLLFERKAGESALKPVVVILPSMLFTTVLLLLHKAMTPSSYTYGGVSPARYRFTQPYVAWTYVKAFFWPMELSADTDMQTFQSPWEPRAILGYIFLAVLLALLLKCAKRPEWRPISFGLCWFLLTLLPTSLAPLAEVTNDHRMFGPTIGLALCLGCLGGLVSRTVTRYQSYSLILGLTVIFCLAGYGTWCRNVVWRTDESLWQDVVLKSPNNGRGWMNYGLSLMEGGKFGEALECFEKAQTLTPNYATLEVNLGIVKAALERQEEAEVHFQRALSLKADGTTRFFYGRWLDERQRHTEAESQWLQATRLNPDDPRPWYGLLTLMEGSGRWAELHDLEPPPVVRSDPDWEHRRQKASLGEAAEEAYWLRETDNSSELDPWLGKSYFLYRAGRFSESLEAAQRAVTLHPGSAKAHNNVAAALIRLERYREAENAATRALSLEPSLEIAKNNLATIKTARKATGGVAEELE